jgi:hypothetical protein
MTVIIFAEEFCDERSVYLLDIDGDYNSAADSRFLIVPSADFTAAYRAI